jgi:hypothetical protein
MVFSFVLRVFLCAFLMMSNLVQQEGRGHRKKVASRMQKSIRAEIAETAREAAEKCLRRPRTSRRHATAPSSASDEDDESFVKSSADSSEDDEHDAVVNNVEVSSTLFKFKFILTAQLNLKLAESLPSKTIPLTQKNKSRRRKKDPKRKRSKSPTKDVTKAASTSKKTRRQSVTIEEVEDEDAPSIQVCS